MSILLRQSIVLFKLFDLLWKREASKKSRDHQGHCKSIKPIHVQFTWKLGLSSGREPERAKTGRVSDVNRFWHRNKARGLDVDWFWVFPPRKKPCDGSCTGCVPAFGPNLSVGVKKGSCTRHAPAFRPNGVGQSQKSWPCKLSTGREPSVIPITVK